MIILNIERYKINFLSTIIMGIKNLHYFLRKTCPTVYSKIPFSKYAFKKIAIDISIFMCKYKNSNGHHYIDSFLNLISTLRYNEIHFVFVYDSKAPPEKDNERKNRIEAREKNKIRIEIIQSLWERFKLTAPGYPDEFLIYKDSLHEKVNDDVLKNFIMKIIENENNDILSSYRIDYEINKLNNSLLAIRTEDFNLTKEFFTACKIPILDAEGEAEATCSELSKKGFVTAVLTEDTDVLAYGAPVMLHKMDINEETFIEIDYGEILQELNLTPDQFLDFCIMCGTDYNQNVPKIGSEKAYKLIRSYGNIEGIIENLPGISFDVLNYEIVRSLFKKKPCINDEYVPYCGFPNRVVLENLHFMNNCKFDLNRLYESFQNSKYHDFEFEQKEEKRKNSLLLYNKMQI